MGPFAFLRFPRLLRRPPRGQRLWIILAVVAIAGLLFGIEQIFGWPEALTPEGGGRRVPRLN
ncbi:MAG: hypothetical protein AAF281_03015 [Pseudomonadota bacterium]